MSKYSNTKNQVWESLNNCHRNTYYEEGPDPMKTWTSKKIAQDLLDYDADLEDCDLQIIEQHVDTWRDYIGRNLRLPSV